MYDVGESLQPARPQSVCSDRKQKWIVSDTLDRSKELEQKLVAQARSLVVVPSNGVNDIILDLASVRQLPH